MNFLSDRKMIAVLFLNVYVQSVENHVKKYTKHTKKQAQICKKIILEMTFLKKSAPQKLDLNI